MLFTYFCGLNLFQETLRALIYICFTVKIYEGTKDRARDTNLEQSAAAEPFPLCRTAHASFDPENYLKSTEGHIRWKHGGDKFKDTFQDSKDKITCSSRNF